MPRLKKADPEAIKKPRKPRVRKLKMEIEPAVPLSEFGKKALEYLTEKKNQSGSTSGYYFGGVYDTGRIKHQENRGCHASLPEIKGAEAIYTFTPPPQKAIVDDKMMEEWAEWMATTSPWAKAKVFYPVKDIKFAAKQGFIIHDTELPGNLIGNFCVATRQPGEHPYHIKQWHEFCKIKGVDPNVAYFIACGIDARGNWSPSWGAHHPITHEELSYKGFVNFCNGVVGSPTSPFKSSGRYTPCNTVWNPKNASGRFSDTIFEKYKDIGKPVESKRAFNIKASPYAFNAELGGNAQWGRDANAAKRSFDMDTWKEILVLESKAIKEAA